jgi:pimeloyl-ACP methyl ester carboxylesterase
MNSATPRPGTASTSADGIADVVVAGRSLAIEYGWTGTDDGDAPLIVFLHEGLGSLATWKDYPQALCAAVGARGLVYSRPGYGRSTPRATDEKWPVDFMHRQAHDVLPALLAHLGIVRPPWLFGHSDGGSIALLHAAAFPERVAGVVAVAPHIFVEDVSIRSIEATRTVYRTTDLPARLARYHADPDSAFWGWNDIWLDPAFRTWNIEDLLPLIRCPVLAVQGADDEYGTMAQIDDLARHVPQAQVLKLARCGHSPHRDQPAALNEAVAAFLRRYPAAPFATAEPA